MRGEQGLGFTDGAKPYSDLEDQSPYICGSFTGWRYKKMMPLHEFSMILAKDEVQSTLEIAKWRTLVREEVTDVGELSRVERAYYDIIAARER